MGTDQSEACVICLLAKQLEKHGIKLQQDWLEIDVEKRAKQFVKAEKDSIRLQKAILKGLAPMRNEQLRHKREIRAKAKQFVAKLSAIPKAAQTQSNFVAERVGAEKTKRSVMEKGLGAIRDAYEENKLAFMFDVTLENEDKAALGVAIPEESCVAEEMPKIDAKQLCQLLHRRQGGTELVRVRGLLDALKKDSPGPDEDKKTNEEIVATEDLTDASLAIRRRVLGQIKDMPIEGGIVLDGNIPQPLTAEELNAMLPNIKLGSGPSDVPSFHDFHNLVIAFEHIWMEAFDGELKENIEDIYKDYAQENKEYTEIGISKEELQEVEDVFSFLQEIKDINDDTVSAAPGVVIKIFAATAEEWNSLSDTQQIDIFNLAAEINLMPKIRTADGNLVASPKEKQLLLKGLAIFSAASGRVSRLGRLLGEINRRLAEPYSFIHFMKDSVNFGLLLTYRQYWQPGLYQVGDLVATIPLAPGEKRKYEIKQVVKRTRSESELEKALISKSREVSGTSRAESEIMEKSSLNSNFKMTAEGTFRFGIGDIRSSSEFTTNSSQESSRVKKDFREAVLKAAQEYKQERSIQVQTTDEITSERTTSGEMSNPNNELTVTYLLYELERQYTISEHIHRVTPVVLVAQDVPTPDEITESWLLAHDWILRRVLLDDSMIPALNYLTDAFAGEEISISIKKANWETQRKIVEELQAAVESLISQRDLYRNQLIANEQLKARAKAAEDAQGWLSEFFENLTVGDIGDVAVADAESKVKSIQKQLEFLEERLSGAREELTISRGALEEATKAYTEALEAQTNRRIAIDQLRIHVKENILYYMQAIWDHEPPDQRFFRLYQIKVALPESAVKEFTIRRATEEEINIGMPTVGSSNNRYIVELEPPALPDPDRPNEKSLVEIADIDHPLGYKGNYIIFPLKQCLYLTNFMMCQFFDDYFGVRDPDLAANFSAEELLTYTEKLLNDPTRPITDEQRAALQSIVMTKLRHPVRDSDLVVVPTGELYMEALLGKHVLLEDFKLYHRFFDMAKARAEWREVELENLRKAARLLQEKPDLEDPEADNRIVVEGATDVHVGTP